MEHFNVDQKDAIVFVLELRMVLCNISTVTLLYKITFAENVSNDAEIVEMSLSIGKTIGVSIHIFYNCGHRNISLCMLHQRAFYIVDEMKIIQNCN